MTTTISLPLGDKMLDDVGRSFDQNGHGKTTRVSRDGETSQPPDMGNTTTEKKGQCENRGRQCWKRCCQEALDSNNVKIRTTVQDLNLILHNREPGGRTKCIHEHIAWWLVCSWRAYVVVHARVTETKMDGRQKENKAILLIIGCSIEGAIYPCTISIRVKGSQYICFVWGRRAVNVQDVHRKCFLGGPSQQFNIGSFLMCRDRSV